MNTFEMKTAIHFGADALGRLRDIPYKRVLVITDPFVVKSGMIDRSQNRFRQVEKNLIFSVMLFRMHRLEKLPKESKNSFSISRKQSLQ